MCFKIVRLTVIRNRPKQTIFVTSGLGLLQVVLEPDIRQCTNEDVGPSNKVNYGNLSLKYTF